MPYTLTRWHRWMAPMVSSTPVEGVPKRPQLAGSAPRRTAKHWRNSPSAVLAYSKMNLSSMVSRTCVILRTSVCMRMPCRKCAVSLGCCRDRTMVELWSRGQSSFGAFSHRFFFRSWERISETGRPAPMLCRPSFRLPPCAYIRDSALFRMRKSVRLPTHFSNPAVGARLKRNTASCPSISAPHSARRRFPELPTTAQVRHRWRRSRCFMSASGSALYAGPLMRNVSFCMPGGLASPANSGSCSWLPQPPAGKPPSRGSSGMNTLLNHSIPSSRTRGSGA
mmetsp:Transcript_7905/g.20314  ORF Transcript_7905/g.20314 Transcript_7905/m.20314 type:complete len:280 (+) Transcript_7905:357-1196(+)